MPALILPPGRVLPWNPLGIFSLTRRLFRFGWSFLPPQDAWPLMGCPFQRTRCSKEARECRPHRLSPVLELEGRDMPGSILDLAAAALLAPGLAYLDRALTATPSDSDAGEVFRNLVFGHRGHSPEDRPGMLSGRAPFPVVFRGVVDALMASSDKQMRGGGELPKALPGHPPFR